MRNLFGAVVLLGLLVAGCDGDSCISRCEQERDMGCVAASTDCEVACDRAHEAELAARSRAQRAGCENQFNNSLTCAEGLAPCENGCGAEASALMSCFAAFCTANPSSDACL